MQTASLLMLLLDRTFGNLFRMLRNIRLPKEERGPLSWNFVGALALVMIYGLIMLFSASYTSGYNNYSGTFTILSVRRRFLRRQGLRQHCCLFPTSITAPCIISPKHCTLSH